MGRGVHVTGAMTDGAARLVGEALRLVGKMEVFADARSVAKGTGLVENGRKNLHYRTEAYRLRWRCRSGSSSYD